jgi:hypothetical protein
MMSGLPWIMNNRERGTFTPSDQVPECFPVARDDSGRYDQVGERMRDSAELRRANEGQGALICTGVPATCPSVRAIAVAYGH